MRRGLIGAGKFIEIDAFHPVLTIFQKLRPPLLRMWIVAEDVLAIRHIRGATELDLIRLRKPRQPVDICQTTQLVRSKPQCAFDLRTGLVVEKLLKGNVDL